MECVKSRSNDGLEPAAKDTIIVSPMARDIANTIDAIIPEVAAGIITLKIISSLVDPNPNAPSRILLGTDDIASSLILAIIGMIITPTTKPGLMALKLDILGKIDLKMGVTSVKAKKP